MTSVQYSVCFNGAGAQGDLDANMKAYIPQGCGQPGIQLMDFGRARWVYLDKGKMGIS